MQSVILDFLKVYLIDIILIIIFISLLVYLWYKGKKKFVKHIILELVRLAEKELGSGTGELKYAYVIDKVYKRLPSIIKLLISEKTLDKMIEDAVRVLSSYLEELPSENINNKDEVLEPTEELLDEKDLTDITNALKEPPMIHEIE